MMINDLFITEDDVNDFKKMSNDEIKTMLYADIIGDFDILFKIYPDFLVKEKNSFGLKELSEESVNVLNDVRKKIKQFDFRELYGLPEGDIDVLLDQFREDNFTNYSRCGNWQRSITKVFNNDGEINSYKTWTAFFRYINKWNQESEIKEYKVLVDNNKILWIGIDEGYHFISTDNNVYGFKYIHKNIILFPNIGINNEYFSDDDMKINDQLILKNRKNIIKNENITFDNAKDILLKEKIGVQIPIDIYFEKVFFYKGTKWNRYFEQMYPNTTTILISIQPKNNLFYIEIENITYPVYGYILFDLNDIRIIEAKKAGKISFIDKSKASYKNWISNNYIYLNRDIHRIFTQDEIDTMLTAFHGSLIHRIKLLRKRIILSFKNFLQYKLIIIKNKFVYIIGLDGFKKELREGSYYGFIYDDYIDNGGKLQ